MTVDHGGCCPCIAVSYACLLCAQERWSGKITSLSDSNNNDNGATAKQAKKS